MKKLFSFVCMLAILASVSLGTSFAIANAASFEDECDAMFFKTLNEMIEDEGIETVHNTIRKEPVYDIRLVPLGYIYYIDLEESDGFAFVVNTTGEFEVTELYFDAEDPYAGYEGDKIYINLMFYAVWDGENLIETQNNVALDPDDDILTENALYGSDDYIYSSSDETIYYTNRIVNEYKLSKRHPAYTSQGTVNACAATAGSNILGFFTRFYPELIPGFEPGTYMGNFYIYKESAAEAIPVIHTLVDYMGTTSEGTTLAGFEKGMKQYCNEKNLSISYTSCMKWNSTLDFGKVKNQFESGLPSAVFVRKFAISELYDYGNREHIYYTIADAPHVMAGFGYSEITYTLSGGGSRTDEYIIVATGLLSQVRGYFNVNYNTKIDEYYSINIY